MFDFIHCYQTLCKTLTSAQHLKILRKRQHNLEKSKLCYNVKVQNIYIYLSKENQNNINQNLNLIKFTVHNEGEKNSRRGLNCLSFFF